MFATTAGAAGNRTDGSDFQSIIVTYVTKNIEQLAFKITNIVGRHHSDGHPLALICVQLDIICRKSEKVNMGK